MNVVVHQPLLVVSGLEITAACKAKVVAVKNVIAYIYSEANLTCYRLADLQIFRFTDWQWDENCNGKAKKTANFFFFK